VDGEHDSDKNDKDTLQALSLETAGGGVDERRGIEEEIKRPLAYGNRTRLG
jgi:hypothetical protein